jgi:hypothetical protein
MYPSRRWFVFVIGIPIIYFLVVEQCELKWAMRFESSVTHNRPFSAGDGANRLFTAMIFGPLQAVLLSSVSLLFHGARQTKNSQSVENGSGDTDRTE